MVAGVKDTSSKAPTGAGSTAVQRTPSTAGADAYRIQMKKAVQGRDGFAAQSAALSPESVQAAAQEGTAGSGGPLPHLAAIQHSFGAHDVSNVHAHTDSRAVQASAAMGAEAYASGSHVAFGKSPDLHTAAHEAAHIVQQRQGVSLEGGVGKAGDSYEQQADAVADKVVAGQSAEGLLGSASGGGGAAVQHKTAVQKKSVTGGPELVKVQEQLNKAGYDCGTPDGIWGPKTSAAVKKFQGDKKLTPDGIIGPATLAALENAAGPAGGAAAGGGGGAAGAGAGAPKTGGAAGGAAGGAKTETKGPAGASVPGASNTLGGAAGASDKKDAGGAPAPAEDKKQEQLPVSGGRQAVAAAAMAEVGKVRAKDMSGKDEEGKPARVGWERLVEYFNVSFGGGWKDMDLVKHRRGGERLKHGTTTGEKESVQDVLPSWCGIFAIWAVKTAGFSVGTWAPGKSASNIMKRQNKVPQVGDVVVSPNHNHHAVIVWVAPDAAEKAATGKTGSIEVKTVDGNSGSNPVSGGEVVDKGSSTMAKWTWGAWSPE